MTTHDGSARLNTPTRELSRRWLLKASGLTAATLVAGSLVSQRRSSAAVTPSARAWFGALEVDPSQDAGLRAVGVDTVTVSIGWDSAQPGRDVWNTDYLAGKRARIEQLRMRGFRVVLDTGLQYPPEWAFSLPGARRLQDQFGRTWAGPIGSNLVNAMFSPAVQDAQRSYLTRLARELDSNTVDSIRVGGLHMGELSFPPPQGRFNALWMYDDTAQAGSPLRGWRPGAGTRDDDALALAYYLGSINQYCALLLDTAATGFPTSSLHLLLPSWGLRTGDRELAFENRLDGSSRGERTGAITQGLDWSTQIPLLSRFGSRGVAYTTWLDAVGQGDSVQLTSPVEYLSRTASPYGLSVAGENTGGSDPADLARCLAARDRLSLVGMQWMNATDLLSSPSFAAQHQQGVLAARTAEPTGPPVGVSAVRSADRASVTITWLPLPMATSYIVTAIGGPGRTSDALVSIGTATGAIQVPATTPTVTLDLQPSTSYSYQVSTVVGRTITQAATTL